VHDDFHRGGIGAALLGALIDTSDTWLNLKRLELTVFVENEPVIRLHRKFDFEIEGTRRAAAGKLSLDGIITHEFALEEINAALDVVRSGAAGAGQFVRR
jgi:RimJ/RimL family protein N-acetyltransferase